MVENINPVLSELFPIADVPHRLPKRNSKKLNSSTVWRWCIDGVQGVRLEHVRCGRQMCTSKEALDRFFARLTQVGMDRLQQRRTDSAAVVPSVSIPDKKRTSKQRQKDFGRAGAELAAMGC